MGESEIAQFLTYLAVERHVAASTQNQALSALLFLYQQVLDRKLDFIDKVERVKRPAKIPVVFTREEARAVLAQLKGDYRLMVHLLYGSGLRRDGIEQAGAPRDRRSPFRGEHAGACESMPAPARERHRLRLPSNHCAPGPLANGFGNMFFRLLSCPSIRAAAKNAGTTWRRKTCKTP